MSTAHENTNHNTRELVARNFSDALTQQRWSERKAAGSGWWFPSPYPNRIFPDGGGHILMQSASDAVSKAIRRAGITDPNITGHSLRHYLATTMLRNGANLRVVQETLGHASLATTQLYAGVTDDEMSDGINLVPSIPTRKHSGRRAKIAA